MILIRLNTILRRCRWANLWTWINNNINESTVTQPSPLAYNFTIILALSTFLTSSLILPTYPSNTLPLSVVCFFHRVCKGVSFCFQQWWSFCPHARPVLSFGFGSNVLSPQWTFWPSIFKITCYFIIFIFTFFILLHNSSNINTECHYSLWRTFVCTCLPECKFH